MKKTKSNNPGSSPVMKKVAVAGAVLAVLIVGLSIAAAKGVFSSPAKSDAARDPVGEEAVPSTVSASSTPKTPGPGMLAMEKATKEKKYLFVFFWRNDDDQTAAMRKVFEEATAKIADRAQTIMVKVTDPADAGIVQEFQVDRAPMPLALAIAPSGAVTGGFPTAFKEEDLVNAFASPCLENCMASLQAGKLVFLCVQNASTNSNDDALKGVNEFKADAKYGSATEIVMLDPSDSAEASFLGDLQIDPKTAVAVTTFLVPPGSPIAQFEGATTKDELMLALQKAATSCGPGGCGPGGCAPGACGPQ
ncbi:MAG: hypothetical protein ACYC6Y_23775 [Thermoguttaceae bacterium]